MKVNDGKTRVKLALRDLKRLLKEEDETGGSWPVAPEELVRTIIEQGIAPDEIDEWLLDQGIADSVMRKEVRTMAEDNLHMVDEFAGRIKELFKDRSKDELEAYINYVKTHTSPEGTVADAVMRAAAREVERELRYTGTISVKPAVTPDDEPIEIIDEAETWDDLLGDILLWYQVDNDSFKPVMVKTGRKFKGFGYVISFNPRVGKYDGRVSETMVYKVWDPKNLAMSEFNANTKRGSPLNIFSDPEGEYKAKWDTTVDMGDSKTFIDFRCYFNSLIKAAKVRCGTDYRHMKNYIAACTRLNYGVRVRSGLPEDLLDQVIEFVQKGRVELPKD